MIDDLEHLKLGNVFQMSLENKPWSMVGFSLEKKKRITSNNTRDLTIEKVFSLIREFEPRTEYRIDMANK